MARIRTHPHRVDDEIVVDEPTHLENAKQYTWGFDGTGVTVETAVEFIEKSESETTGLAYDIPATELREGSWIACDFLLGGSDIVQFGLQVEDETGDSGAVVCFGTLNRCQTRLRCPIEKLVRTGETGAETDGEAVEEALSTHDGLRTATDWGDPLPVDDVAVLKLIVIHKGEEPATWEQTPIEIHEDVPPRVTDPLLPEGPLVDRFGQSTLRDWDQRVEDADELTATLAEQRQAAEAGNARPEGRSEYGGLQSRDLGATGFFRIEHDGDRWWFVDPDGHPFVSVGIRSVTPTHETPMEGIEAAFPPAEDFREEIYDAVVSYSSLFESDVFRPFLGNQLRAFGSDWRSTWRSVTKHRLRELGFNTIDNHEVPTESDPFPYVRTIDLSFSEVPTLFWDFPDVFHEDLPRDVLDSVQVLSESVSDPHLLGYMYSSGASWTFYHDIPAVGMLKETETCESRAALVDFLRDRHGTDDLGAVWNMDVGYDDVLEGTWVADFTEAARQDLREFNDVLLERYYQILAEQSRSVDPNHLNLGFDFSELPDEWVLNGYEVFDVLCGHVYGGKIQEGGYPYESIDLPVLGTEFDFGALDVGLCGAGPCWVSDQRARGVAYRSYVEDAVSRPWCLGTHWFQLYDQPVLGRADGECYNMGFFDVCNQLYEDLGDAAATTHDRIYEVAAGSTDPVPHEVEILGDHRL